MPRIYVGNLALSVTRDQLVSHFAKAGEVRGALVLTDKVSKRSKGFGFVEMADAEDAAYAMSTLNGSELGGQRIQIDGPKAARRPGPPRKIAAAS